MHEVSPPKFKEYQDEWGTSAREGYEDHGPARPTRTYDRDGGSLLKAVGSIAIVGGVLWGTYLVAQSGSVANLVTILQQNHGPVVVIGLGALSSLLGRFLRL